MRLYTVRDAKGEWVGAEKDGGLVDLTAAGSSIDHAGPRPRGGRRSAGRSHRGRERQRAASPLEGAELAAPIRPSKILCSGINYRGHALENPNAKMPTEPFFFAKLPTSVIGPDEPIVHPKRTQQLDYEVEFAVVVGARLSNADGKRRHPARSSAIRCSTTCPRATSSSRTTKSRSARTSTALRQSDPAS